MDFFLLFGLFLGNFVCFALLHLLALRLHDPRRPFTLIILLALLSTLVTVVVSHSLLAQYFSSFKAYILAVTAAAWASFLGSGLYAFLGPITAERSCTAHFLIYLDDLSGTDISETGLIKAFDAQAFMIKRFKECEQARLLVRKGGKMFLTKKGKRLAKAYRAMTAILRLKSRKQYLASFPQV